MQNRLLTSFLFLFLFIHVSEGSAQKISHTQQNMEYEKEYSVTLKGASKTPISDHIMGFNLVYPQESDAVWEDGKVEQHLKDVNTSVLRWPGGTVSTYYHWDNLTGRKPPWRDNWDPNQSVTAQPDSEFMDIDEYLDLIAGTGATPLMGINIDSGRRWDRMEDGINEALALMQYVKDKGIKVKYWYLGNEPYLEGSNGGIKSPKDYANLVNVFADAMREFDPDIKIVANWGQGFGQGFENRYHEYLDIMTIAGHNIDIVDVHWYWKYGGPTMELWLEDTPMKLHTGETYIEEIAMFKEQMAFWSTHEDYDLEHVQLAALEWNTGGISDGQLTPDQLALMQSELMMQFILGGLDMATFWPLQWQNIPNNPRSFVDRYNNNNAHPVYNIFKFLGKFQGGSLISKQVTQSQSNVLNLVAMDKEDNTLRVSFLNKNDENIRVNLGSDQFDGARLQSAQTYTYETASINLLEKGTEGISFVAPTLSMTMLTFEDITITSIDDHGNESEQPVDFALNQNYPKSF
ncbi:MAG: hypothetical protein WD267_09350 [Balneolales bacterium]